MAESKYPKEIVSIIKQKTFSIEEYLEESDLQKGEEALTLYSKTFSRFKFIIIANGQVVTANMAIRDVFSFFVKSDFAKDKELESMFDEKKTTIPIAYSVRFTSGRFKGKTPAEVLLEGNPQYEKELYQHRNYLFSKLSQYPGNKVQIQATDQAFQLKQQGKLDSNASSNRKMVLYSSGLRPLIRMQNRHGNKFVYQMNIEWLHGEKNPVQITIQNFYAPVIRLQDGRLNVKVKEREMETFKNFQINLSFDEWMYVIHMMKSNVELFEASIYSRKRKEAQDHFFENKKKYKASFSQNNTPMPSQYPQTQGYENNYSWN